MMSPCIHNEEDEENNQYPGIAEHEALSTSQIQEKMPPASAG